MNGSSFSEEHKNKLKIARKGRKPSLGMKHSEDAKLKISMANSGINHHQFNKPVSIETKRKISSAKIGKCSGVKNPAAIIDNMIAKQIRNKYANLNYTYMQLAKEYNISCSTVGRVIRGENWK